jgi:signal peptidase II
LMDRLRLGAVTDFLDFIWINYPVFNLADSFIFLGVIVLLIAYVNQFNKTSCS